MRIVICCNHTYPHCGGSEKVVKQISESMAADPYRHEVIVLSRSSANPFQHNGVQYLPCGLGKYSFVSHLQELKPDHTHIYSDYFAYWPDLLRFPEKVPGTKSIALVGMNYMINRNADMLQLHAKKDHFRLITHSNDYQDYHRCQDEGLNVTVIPNGVDLGEFDSVEPDAFGWAEGRKVILCVSNFFPGKGQEYLIEVLRRLQASRKDDWAIQFVCSTVNFPFASFLTDRIRQQLANAPYRSRFVIDQPRQDTLRAFKGAYAFAFPSQKEVAPIVALESQACSLPWVAMPVGNLRQLQGGLLVPSAGKDMYGNLKYNDQTYNVFASHLNMLLESKTARDNLGRIGREQIEKDYNWKNIASQYNEVFTR